MIITGLILNLVIGVGTLTSLWLIYLWKRNAAIVDLGWAMGLTLMGLTHYLRSDDPMLGRLWLMGLVLLWGLRLGGYLFWTRLRVGKKDARYETLSGRSRLPAVWFFLIHYLIQACFQAAVGVVFIFTAQHATWASLSTALGLALWCVGYAGSIMADVQLHRFRRQPDHQGKICSQGLWQYSRHPNYFFEILLWFGLALIGLQSPWGWLGFISPLTLGLTMTLITGPISERQSLTSKPEAYRQYQQSTSMIVPWFKTRPARSASQSDK